MNRVMGVAAMLSVAAMTAAAHTQSRDPLVQTAPTAAVALEPTAGQRTGIWQPRAGLKQVPIWPGNAPDGTLRPQPPENVETYKEPPEFGGKSEAVLDIAVPTMTIMPPSGRNKGTAVIVFPGGGFQKVFITLEGTEICDWLTVQGITCIVSKYRAPGGNEYWDDGLQRHITPKIMRALQDAQRTIRLVRSKAKELNIDPNKIGVMGFSAGGYLVAQTSNILTPAYKPVDAIDRISSRPDFAVALYPGHICRKGTFDPTLPIIKTAPPTFIAQAWNDPIDPVCNSLMYASALDNAGVSTELHLFAKGGHAFGLRKKDEPVGVWPQLVERWMKQLGFL
jgi:acetyl esterase/lipase